MNSSEQIILNNQIYNAENISQVNLNKLPDWEKEIFLFSQDWFDDSETIKAYTSGSTGKPKEILLTKEMMRNSARMTNRFFGLDATKTALLCLPASYIAGKMMLVRAIVGGFYLLPVKPKANPFENIQETIDFTAITPYQLQHSLKRLKKADVKNIIVGGAHINQNLENKTQELSASIYETYGMTETASHIALRKVNGTGKSDFFTALEGVELKQNSDNCLIINASHLSEDEFVTNDIVEINDKNSFRWLGRFDNVINSGGIKIFPEQVEKKLEEIISHRYFITSLPDEILGNKVILVIESEKPNKKGENFLKEKLTFSLKKYEIPKEIFYVSHFVYSSSNKILKGETMRLL